MTPEEKKLLQINFRKDGFIFIPGFLNEEEVSLVHTHLEKLIREEVPSMLPEQVFYEDRNDLSSLKQIQTLYAYDSFFYEMMFA